MDYRVPEGRDLVLCGAETGQWAAGVLVDFTGLVEAQEGPKVRLLRWEILSSYPFLPPEEPAGFLAANSTLSP